jgi:predicted acylesterase/phospholipase RssA
VQEAVLPLAADGAAVGLVLSGGGARGAFQIGVWEVLYHDARGLQRLPDVISGTSAGALNGALMAAGLSPGDMLAFWLELARRPPVVANRRFFQSLERALLDVARQAPFRSLRQRGRSLRILATVLRKHGLRGRGSWLAGALEYVLTARFEDVSHVLERVETAFLFSTQPLRARLAEVLGGHVLQNPQCRLAINTVDVRTGQAVRFVSHPPHAHAEQDPHAYRYGAISLDAILASASIPLLFDPIAVDGQLLWDGGLLVNTPIAPTVALGADRIIPVLVTAGGGAGGSTELTLGAAVERLADTFLENAYNTDRKLLLERNRMARTWPERGLRVAHLYEAIRPTSRRVFNAGSYLYFERGALLEMYEAGREAARHWLDRGPRLDTHPGPEHAE